MGVLRFSPVVTTEWIKSMQYEIPLTYSEALLREAVVRFWWRAIGWNFLIATAFVMLVFGFLLYQGDASWVVGFLGAALALIVGLMIALYVAHYRNTLYKFRQMKSPHAVLTVSEPSFTLSSDVGSSTLKWSTIVEVWRFPTFWLLLFSKAQFSTLPLAGVSPEVQTLILERVKSAGGKIS